MNQGQDGVDGRAAAIPEDVTDAGRRARSGFTYQDECAALALLSHLGHSGLEAVVVERSTDLILLPRSSVPAELVSIKHREPNRSGANSWTWSELKKKKVLADLFTKWDQAGRRNSLAFWSNAGFSEGTQELWLVCAERRLPSPDLVERVRDHTGCSTGDAADFLAALNLPHDPLPARGTITDVGIQRTVDLLREHRPRSADSAPACYDQLLRRIANASDLSRNPLDPIVAVAATLAQANERRDELRLRRSYLSRTSLIDGLIFLHDQIDARQLPDVGWHLWEQDPHFTGRLDAIDRLDALLQPGAPSPVAPVVVHGGTGFGKTSLATNYAASRNESFRPIFIDGTTRLSVIRNLAELAGDANPERWNRDLARASGPVTPRLPGNSATLIVIDGVTDATVLRGIVPRRSLCRVLITTNRSHLDQGYEYIGLGPWNRQDAHRFIEAALPATEPQQCDNLADALGNHPLAITQAVNYCRVTRRPIDHFLRRLADKPTDALRLGSATGHAETVVQSVALNIEAAREQESASFELICLLAHMSADPFDETVLRSGKEAYAIVAAEEATHMPLSAIAANNPEAGANAISARAEAIYLAISDENTLEQAANVLVGMSLAERRDTGLVIHPLVKVVARNLAGEPRPWLEIGLAPFLQLLQPHPTTFHERTERHVSHALRLVETAMASSLYGPAVAVVCLHVASYLAIHGDWGAALIGARNASEFTGHVATTYWDRAHTGETYWPLAIELRLEHAVTLTRTGRNREAEAELFTIIKQASAIGDGQHQLQALLTVTALAATVDGGQRAEHVLMQLDNIPEHLATGSPPTIASIGYIRGKALASLGRIAEATAINKATLSATHNADVPDHLLADLHIDAVTFARYTKDNQGMLDNAKAVLDIRRRNSHGRPNWLLIDALHAYADAAIDAGDLFLTDQLITEAEELAREYLTTDCGEYGKILGVRGRLNMVTGQVDNASADLSRAAEILRPGTDLDRLHLPAVLVHLAIVEAHQSRISAALELISEAIDLDTQRFGVDHQETRFDIDIRDQILRGEDSLQIPELSQAYADTSTLTWVFARLCRVDITDAI